MSEADLAVMPKASVARPAGRTVLSPDWLPIALLIGDSIIAGISVLVAYWYRYNLDRINPTNGQELAFGPYLVAVPAVIVIFAVSLAVNRQYRSWRGRTLVDQLLSLYSGIALAAVLKSVTRARGKATLLRVVKHGVELPIRARAGEARRLRVEDRNQDQR